LSREPRRAPRRREDPPRRDAYGAREEPSLPRRAHLRGGGGRARQRAVTAAEDPLPVVRAAEIDDAEVRPRWLVTSLWARAGVGILGGAPKCCKSWLALEMALAVASGAPCLGVFEVG